MATLDIKIKDLSEVELITQWLVCNGKTPLDNDLNYIIIAENVGLAPNVVHQILVKNAQQRLTNKRGWLQVEKLRNN
jgi:hypothetical protein